MTNLKDVTRSMVTEIIDKWLRDQNAEIQEYNDIDDVIDEVLKDYTE